MFLILFYFFGQLFLVFSCVFNLRRVFSSVCLSPSPSRLKHIKVLVITVSICVSAVLKMRLQQFIYEHFGYNETHICMHVCIQLLALSEIQPIQFKFIQLNCNFITFGQISEHKNCIELSLNCL